MDETETRECRICGYTFVTLKAEREVCNQCEECTRSQEIHVKHQAKN